MVNPQSGLSKNNVSMTKIESRPSKHNNWEYIFYLDIDGHISQKKLKDATKNIEKLSNHMNAYKDAHDSLGKTIRTVVNHFNKSSKEFNKIDKDIIKISSGKNSIGFEEDILDTPQLDE